MSLTYTDVGNVTPLHALEVSGQVFIQEPDRTVTGTDVPFEIFSDYSSFVDSQDPDESLHRSSRQFRMRIRAYGYNKQVRDVFNADVSGIEYMTSDIGIDFLGRFAFWGAPGYAAVQPFEKGIVLQSHTAFVGLGTKEPTFQLTVTNTEETHASQSEKGGGQICINDPITLTPGLFFQVHNELLDPATHRFRLWGGHATRKDWTIGVNQSGNFHISMGVNGDPIAKALELTESSLALSGANLVDGTTFAIGAASGGLHISSETVAEMNYAVIGVDGAADHGAGAGPTSEPYVCLYRTDFADAAEGGSLHLNATTDVVLRSAGGAHSIVREDGFGVLTLDKNPYAAIQVGPHDVTPLEANFLDVDADTRPILVVCKPGNLANFQANMSTTANNADIVPGLVLCAPVANSFTVAGSVDVFQSIANPAYPVSGLAFSVGRASFGQDPDRHTVATCTAGDPSISEPPAFNVYGNLNCTGTKNFAIDHPILPERKLRHAAVEAPRGDLIYRGKCVLRHGRGEVDVDVHSDMTPGTFAALTRGAQLFLSNNETFAAVRGRVRASKITIEASDDEADCTVDWMVVAERKDPDYVGSAFSPE